MNLKKLITDILSVLKARRIEKEVRTFLRAYNKYSPYDPIKLMVIGYARHGKDEVCNMLKNNYEFRYVSPSLVAAEKFIFDELKDKNLYMSPQECYEDRDNHRPHWFNSIAAYNAEDKARLAKDVLKHSDIYCGMRCKEELQETVKQNVVTHTLWVDRSQHKEPESSDSCTVDSSMAHYLIDNNKSLSNTRLELAKTMRMIALRKATAIVAGTNVIDGLFNRDKFSHDIIMFYCRNR